jgi:CRP-like cAMP-binding protein
VAVIKAAGVFSFLCRFFFFFPLFSRFSLSLKRHGLKATPMSDPENSSDDSVDERSLVRATNVTPNLFPVGSTKSVDAAASALAKEEQKARPSERLRVTLHRAAALPAMDSDGFSDPYCVLKLKSGGKSFESKCMRNTLDPVWEETFEFPLNANSRATDALRIDVFDRDWVFGVPLKPDYMGEVVLDLAGVGDGIEKQWFPLRNSDGGLYQDAQLQISVYFVAVDMMEHGDAFWKMLLPAENESHNPAAILLRHHRERVAKRADAGGTAVVPLNDDPQQVEVLRTLFPLIRPIINNLFRALYVAVRPLMLFGLWHRKILMDWEKPGMAILMSIIFFWCWYRELLLALVFFYSLGWILVTFAAAWSFGAEADAAALTVKLPPQQLNTAEMLEAYKQTKAELFYGELDPLAKDLETLERVTRGFCDVVERYRDNLFFYHERRVVGFTVGLLSVLGLICTILSSIVDDLTYWSIRVTTLLLYMRFVIFLPLSWRYPSLFPTIITFVLRPFRRPIRDVQLWMLRKTQLRELTSAEEALESQRVSANSRSATKAMWETLQKDVGRKFTLRKSQLLEVPGKVSHVVYFLSKGKVESRAPNAAASSVGTMLSAPCSLFVPNILLSHGVITHSVTGVVNSKLFAFNVADLRYYFEKNPLIAEKFFLDLAVELASEVKFATLKSLDEMKDEAKADATAASALAPSPQAGDVVAAVPVPQSGDRSPRQAADHALGPKNSALHQTADFFSMRALNVEEEAPLKLWRFFQETFRVTVKYDQLKVFDKGVWTKKGWSRFPGRVFLTPHHIAFWSQVGKKSVLGSASKGAGVESWIIPLEAILSFSLHARESHIKLTIDTSNPKLALLEQHSSVFEIGKSKKKAPSIKICSDDQQQLTELRRSIELVLSRSVVHETAEESNVEDKIAMLSTLVGVSSTPILSGVELTAGTLHIPDIQKVLLSFLFLFFFVTTLYKKQVVAAGRIAPFNLIVRGGMHVATKAAVFGKRVGAQLAAPFRVVDGQEVGDVVDEDVKTVHDIMATRASVLTEEDRAALMDADEDLLFFGPDEVVFEADHAYERALYSLMKGEVCVFLGHKWLVWFVSYESKKKKKKTY